MTEPLRFPDEPIKWDRGFLRPLAGYARIEYQCRRCGVRYMGNEHHRCSKVGPTEETKP